MWVGDIFPGDRKDWIGFSVNDADGRPFLNLFAKKNEYGDLIAGMKNRTVLNVVGKVVHLNHEGWYGLVCEKIDRATTTVPSK